MWETFTCFWVVEFRCTLNVISAPSDSGDVVGCYGNGSERSVESTQKVRQKKNTRGSELFSPGFSASFSLALCEGGNFPHVNNNIQHVHKIRRPFSGVHRHFGAICGSHGTTTVWDFTQAVQYTIKKKKRFQKSTLCSEEKRPHVLAPPSVYLCPVPCALLCTQLSFCHLWVQVAPCRCGHQPWRTRKPAETTLQTRSWSA